MKKRVRLDLLCGFIALGSLLFTQPAIYGQSKSSKTLPPFPDGPPLTVKNLVDFMNAHMAEERMIMGLKKRGVGFRPTQDSLDLLVALAAPRAVVDLVRELGDAKFPAPPPPPPPPPPQKFAMMFQCEPAECEARVGEMPFRKSTGGKVLFEGLDPGRIIVDSQKQGYVSRTDVMNLQPSDSEKTVRGPVILSPTPESQSKWGEQLFEETMAAVPTQPVSRTVAGTLKVSNGSVTTFDISVNFESAGTANIELQSSAGRAVVLCKSWRCFVPSAKPTFKRIKAQLAGGKLLKPEEIDPFIPDLEWTLAYEFEEMRATLLEAKAGAAATSDPADMTAPKTFSVSRAGGAYTVELGDNMKPGSVAYDSGTGVGHGIRVAYRDYKKIGDTDYPSTTEFRFAGEKRSILFQARTVAHNAAQPKAGPASPK